MEFRIIFKFIAVLFLAASWFMFVFVVDQRYDCPMLQAIAKWGNRILLIGLLIYITVNGLWC